MAVVSRLDDAVLEEDCQQYVRSRYRVALTLRARAGDATRVDYDEGRDLRRAGTTRPVPLLARRELVRRPRGRLRHHLNTVLASCTSRPGLREYDQRGQRPPASISAPPSYE